MTFDVAAEDYGRFMGRYSEPLAEQFVDLVLSGRQGPALDVGCGPGTVTAVLVGRLGAEQVAAVDPSPSFVAAARERFPTVDVRAGSAEDLPFDDAMFELAVAQLVVPFMDDPQRGLSQMRRVVRPGGVVAVCAWDSTQGPIAPYWRAADELDPGAARAMDLPGAREGQLADMATRSGLEVVVSTTLTVHVEVATFEEWWEPFAYGIGPAGEYFVSLTSDQQAALRRKCAEVLTDEPIQISGTARAVVARRGRAEQES